jgi:hypothetical protein
VLHTKIVEGSMMHVSRPVSYPPSPEFSWFSRLPGCW